MPKVHEPVYDEQGRIIPGLTCTTWTRRKGEARRKRYKLVGRKVYFGFDKTEAIRRFRAWQARQTREFVEIDRDTPDEWKEHMEYLKETGPLYNLNNLFPAYRIEADHYWESVRHAILTDPKEAAKRTGIPELAYLERIEKPKPSLTPDAMLDLYMNRRKRITAGERTNIRAAWKLFVERLDVGLIEDATEDSVDAWHAEMWAKVEAEQWTEKTMRNHMLKVTAVAKHAAGKGHRWRRSSNLEPAG